MIGLASWYSKPSPPHGVSGVYCISSLIPEPARFPIHTELTGESKMVPLFFKQGPMELRSKSSALYREQVCHLGHDTHLLNIKWMSNCHSGMVGNSNQMYLSHTHG